LAKIHQIRFQLGQRAHTPLGELTPLPIPLAGFEGKGPNSKGREGKDMHPEVKPKVGATDKQWGW